MDRRGFLLMGAAVPMAVQATLTAGMVVDRIKSNIGIPWRTQTVDNIVAGNADVAVKGIATTMMATLDVCKRANEAGKNMVITHESTFFSHQDAIDQLTNNETYLYKRDYLNRHGMAVFHFHDHWHGRHPDGIAAGMVGSWAGRRMPMRIT